MSLFNTVLSAASSLGLGKEQKEQASLLPALIHVVNQYPGGVNGLITAFQQGGLEAIVSSWMNQGENLPVEPSQIQNVLGDSVVSDLAQKSGLNESSVLSHLTTLLPVVIDKVFTSSSDNAPAQLDATTLMTSVLGLLSKK